MAPDLPRLPQRTARRAPQHNSATFLALFGMMVLGMGLMGLMAIVLPQIQGLILVVMGAASIFAIHYVIWGHWLSRIVERDPLDELPTARLPDE